LTNAKEMMRRDWDERARRDAFLYIASWRSDWDEKSFFDSGEQDYQRLVAPILKELSVDPSNRTMAELGCGAGRMTRAFARYFAAVSAVDISAEMQARAKQYLTDFSNIRWILSDGESLAGLQTASVDFAFSYLVLQHMPNRDVVARAIQEMLRILKPAGAFLFQFNGSDRPTMNWKGRTISALLDRLASSGLTSWSAHIADAAGIDPAMVGKTWRGAYLSSQDAGSIARAAGAATVQFRDESTPMAWCYGRKG
jgi:SAM-dependent methyltransferase